MPVAVPMSSPPLPGESNLAVRKTKGAQRLGPRSRGGGGATDAAIIRSPALLRLRLVKSS
ncbi:MAG: hypothetical protein ACK56I_07480 [bacterium]